MPRLCSRFESHQPPAARRLDYLMRAVVQRVSSARVRVDRRIVGEIGAGLLVFAGVEHVDGPEDVKYIAGKIRDLRIFDDAAGKMNLSVVDTAAVSSSSRNSRCAATAGGAGGRRSMKPRRPIWPGLCTRR